MIITNEKEYLEALELIEKIWTSPQGTLNGKLLEILADQIEAWEEKHYPIPEPSPEEAKKFRKEQEMDFENYSPPMEDVKYVKVKATTIELPEVDWEE